MKQQLEINGRKLSLESAGPANGHLVVFLHHGLGASRSWKEQVGLFSTAGYQVLTYDRWGHGKSAPRDHWSMPDFEQDLADLEAILDEYGHRQASLVGHSDGGNIAMHYAVNHPEQITCLVLVAAHIYIEPKMNSGIQSIKHQFEGDHHFRRQMQRVHGDNTEALFWGWFNGWSHPSILDWDMRPVSSQISCPTLVIQGLEDGHASPQHARDIADSIPGADLWLVPGAGHMLPQTHPEEFNLRLRQFLGQTLAVQTQP
jgi:pimeloyl-ACP methyl ester carboxylesterase